MRIGGWWRLWIGLSALWVVLAIGVAFFIVERPTPASVAKGVGLWCDLDMPVPPELAGRVLDVPAQLARLDSLEGDSNAAARKPIVEAVKSTVEALAAHAGKADDYDVNLVQDPDGKKRIVLAPARFTEVQIFEQANKDKYALNSWNQFQGYCVEQLQAQARNALYPRELREWALSTLAGVLSFPLLSLLLGAFVGWVWRGFRPNKNAGT